jgi:purine-binding chemotaxis protein CheW
MEEKFLIFAVRDKKYALPTKIIGEVAALDKVFPLPLVPHYVRGIINRYSVPYALIDISYLLFNDTQAADAPLRKVIVLKEELDKLAFLIDDVTDIADLSSESLMKIEQEEMGAASTGAIGAFFEWKGSEVFCLETREIINGIKREFEQLAA